MHYSLDSYRLFNPGDIVSNANAVSTAFIDECVEQGTALDVEKYRSVYKSNFLSLV